ncbi:MAG: hypothetical protein KJ957_03355 [Candidatus Omnitrophica bacterium]|nr:hypothetical protein [Candidatus Omnitrophota bacterium]MBU1853065.1 hypothetical protein [Candidatus Omnitrophota bacterium]
MVKDLNITIKRLIWRRLREGKRFKHIFSCIQEIDRFSKEEIRRLQLETLKEIIRHSYSSVPYYRRLFDSIGLSVNGRFNFEDIAKIPFLTKDEIARNTHDFISSHSKKAFLKKTASSGTTGRPVVLYRDLYSINFENAILWKQRSWAGIKHGDKKATIRGEFVVDGSKNKPPFWKIDWLGKELILSSYHISSKNVRYYLEILKNFRPHYIEAYPSSLYLLARFIKDLGLESVPVKAAITSSEMIEDYKKALIEDVFRCKVYDFYGNAERVSAIATCPAGNYHILPEYGFTELIDLKEDKYNKELTGTSFINMSMPLIRYRTGDMVVPSPGQCECGRQSQVVQSIIGRLDDIIVTPEGRYIPVIDSILDRDFYDIVEIQFIQEDHCSIRVRLVPGRDFGNSDRNKLISKLSERIGSNMKIYVEEVDSIERAKNGKYRTVISNIKRKEYE